MAVITEVGDGANTFFWKDRWLAGKSIQELAPRVHALVPKITTSRCTVRQALCDGKWLEDIQGEISVEALMEFLELWDVLSDVDRQEGIHDKHVWRLSGSG